MNFDLNGSFGIDSLDCNYDNGVKNGGSIQTVNMSISPPDAPPYPTTPEDDRPDEEASSAAYAEILVRWILRKKRFDWRFCLGISMVFWI